MVMFKARFKPLTDKPRASETPRNGSTQQRQKAQQQQQPQPERQEPQVPPIEEERGPQHPVKLPGEPHEPERALADQNA
jgi:hypothetical protein